MLNKMSNLPLVYVIVLNYRGPGLTIKCLDSLLKLGYPNFRVIVVDNGSGDDSVAQLKAATTDPRVNLLINETNEGYAGGNNRGIEKALAEGAEYVFVLNNDTIVNPGCLDPLVAAFEADNRIAIAGCEIRDVGYESSPNRGQRISLFTGKTNHWRHDRPVLSPMDVDFICGAAIMLRASVLREIGAFDSSFFSYCEDADICFRARKSGYRVCFVPGPGVRHLMGATAKAAGNRALVNFCLNRNHIWFVRRHGRLGHRIVFALVTFCYQYPKALLGRVMHGEADLLWPLVKSVWSGYSAYSPYARPSRASGSAPPHFRGHAECAS